MPLHTIDQVIEELTRIIDRARAEGSRIGYFAALYRRVTVGVKDRIGQNVFEDGPRMERFDAIFASRYLDALARYQAGQPPGLSWALAFDASAKRRPLILQHLLLGMNAHINLDLGIAAAEVMRGADLSVLRADFDRINAILADMVDVTQGELSQISPGLDWLDRVGAQSDEALVRFSIRKAREHAWRLAQTLAGLGETGAKVVIAARDAAIAVVGHGVLHPGPLVAVGLFGIRARESNDVARNIEFLARAG